MKTNEIKTLLVEQTKIGNSETDAIILHDQTNKRSSYIYMSEVEYQKWVIEEVKAYKANGYNIINSTDINLTVEPELTPEMHQVTKYTPSVNYIKYYKYKGILVEITSEKMHKFFSKSDDHYLYFDTAKDAKMYISEFKSILI